MTRAFTPARRPSRIRSLIALIALGPLFGLPGASPQADDHADLSRLVREGGAIELASKTYRLTRPVVIDLQETGFISLHGRGTAQVIMEGAGPAFRLIGHHDGTANPDTVKQTVWDRERMPLIDGIEILGAHAEANGIEARGTMQLTLSRLNIRHCRHAIHLVERNRNVLISDCHLYQNRGIGIYLDDVNLHQINVANSHISYNLGGGIVNRAGNVRNLHIGNCDLESNMPPDRDGANVLLDSRGGSHGIAEVAITGCTIQHQVRTASSANVRIFGNSNFPSPVPGMPTREGHVVITGNVFSDVAVNIDFSNVRSAAITGNTFWQGRDANLRVKHSSNLVITGNLFDRNPRYREGSEWKNGIEFEHCQDVTLSGNHLHGTRSPAAISVRHGRRFHLTGNTILDASGVGIRLEHVRDSRLSDSLIRANQDAPTESPSEFIPVEIIGGGDNEIFLK